MMPDSIQWQASAHVAPAEARRQPTTIRRQSSQVNALVCSPIFRFSAEGGCANTRAHSQLNIPTQSALSGLCKPRLSPRVSCLLMRGVAGVRRQILLLHNRPTDKAANLQFTFTIRRSPFATGGNTATFDATPSSSPPHRHRVD